jgi:hypothetical protein
MIKPRITASRQDLSGLTLELIQHELHTKDKLAIAKWDYQYKIAANIAADIR